MEFKIILVAFKVTKNYFKTIFSKIINILLFLIRFKTVYQKKKKIQKHRKEKYLKSYLKQCFKMNL